MKNILVLGGFLGQSSNRLIKFLGFSIDFGCIFMRVSAFILFWGYETLAGSGVQYV